MNIGIELELPVVNNHDGTAASYESVRGLFQELVECHGFQPYFDAFTKAWIGVKKRQGQGWLDVGTDFGFCTLEIAFPPEPDFFSAETAWNVFMDSILLPMLSDFGLSVLGYGCQPKTDVIRPNYIADKGHYQLWDKIVARHDSHYSFDRWPGFASLQFNIDVPVESIVLASNALIRLAPLIWAWSEHSAVCSGRLLEIASIRVEGYRTLAENNPFFRYRLNFPQRLFDSLADYMLQAWEQPIFEIARNQEIYHPVDQSLSTLEFIQQKSAEFTDLQGKVHIIDCESTDLAQGLVFYWPAARIKVQLDLEQSVTEILKKVLAGDATGVLKSQGSQSFLEIRHLPAMDREDAFAWLAFFLGLLADIDACNQLMEHCDIEIVQASAKDVLSQGWETDLAGRSLYEWGTNLRDIVRGGLGCETPALLPYIEPLIVRLDKRITPAQDVMDCLHRNGLDGLIELLKIRPRNN